MDALRVGHARAANVVVGRRGGVNVGSICMRDYGARLETIVRRTRTGRDSRHCDIRPIADQGIRAPAQTGESLVVGSIVSRPPGLETGTMGVADESRRGDSQGSSEFGHRQAERPACLPAIPPRSDRARAALQVARAGRHLGERAPAARILRDRSRRHRRDRRHPRHDVSATAQPHFGGVDFISTMMYRTVCNASSTSQSRHPDALSRRPVAPRHR